MIARARLDGGAESRPRDATNPATMALAPAAPIVGIDVGERALDLAIAGAGRVRLCRIALAGGDNRASGAIAQLTARLLDAAPELALPGAVAIIDSPRRPRASARQTESRPASRRIDRQLAAIVRQIKAARATPAPALGLWLFPTPALDEFVRCARDSACPAHLACYARELFTESLGQASGDSTEGRGAPVFTRFMIAGFALYSALATTPAECFEGYPDLALRLWNNGGNLPPKRAGRRRALAARRRIVAGLSRRSGLDNPRPTTLDQADAAILAVSAFAARASGAIAVIEEPGEGRFALALDYGDAAAIRITEALQISLWLTRGDSRSNL